MENCKDMKCGKCLSCVWQAEKDAQDQFSRDVTNFLLGGESREEETTPRLRLVRGGKL